jgi:hypothetical protein
MQKERRFITNCEQEKKGIIISPGKENRKRIIGYFRSWKRIVPDHGGGRRK